jgi:hypothetical protein
MKYTKLVLCKYQYLCNTRTFSFKNWDLWGRCLLSLTFKMNIDALWYLQMFDAAVRFLGLGAVQVFDATIYLFLFLCVYIVFLFLTTLL